MEVPSLREIFGFGVSALPWCISILASAAYFYSKRNNAEETIESDTESEGFEELESSDDEV